MCLGWYHKRASVEVRGDTVDELSLSKTRFAWRLSITEIIAAICISMRSVTFFLERWS